MIDFEVFQSFALIDLYMDFDYLNIVVSEIKKIILFKKAN